MIDTHHGEEISGIALTKTDAGREDLALRATPDCLPYVGHHEAVRELAPGMVVLLAGDDTLDPDGASAAPRGRPVPPRDGLDGVNIRIDQYAGRYFPAEKAEAICAQVATVDT